jgi:hypothetical protein
MPRNQQNIVPVTVTKSAPLPHCLVRESDDSPTTFCRRRLKSAISSTTVGRHLALFIYTSRRHANYFLAVGLVSGRLLRSMSRGAMPPAARREHDLRERIPAERRTASTSLARPLCPWHIYLHSSVGSPPRAASGSHRHQQARTETRLRRGAKLDGRSDRHNGVGRSVWNDRAAFRTHSHTRRRQVSIPDGPRRWAAARSIRPGSVRISRRTKMKAN